MAPTYGGGGQPEDTFTSIVAGINIPAPEINVTVGGTALTDNFSTVDFGTAGQGKTGPTRTFTVSNSGDDVLSVGTVSVPAGFTADRSAGGADRAGGE